MSRLLSSCVSIAAWTISLRPWSTHDIGNVQRVAGLSLSKRKGRRTSNGEQRRRQTENFYIGTPRVDVVNPTSSGSSAEQPSGGLPRSSGVQPTSITSGSSSRNLHGNVHSGPSSSHEPFGVGGPRGGGPTVGYGGSSSSTTGLREATVLSTRQTSRHPALGSTSTTGSSSSSSSSATLSELHERAQQALLDRSGESLRTCLASCPSWKSIEGDNPPPQETGSRRCSGAHVVSTDVEEEYMDDDNSPDIDSNKFFCALCLEGFDEKSNPAAAMSFCACTAAGAAADDAFLSSSRNKRTAWGELPVCQHRFHLSCLRQLVEHCERDPSLAVQQTQVNSAHDDMEAIYEEFINGQRMRISTARTSNGQMDHNVGTPTSGPPRGHRAALARPYDQQDNEDLVLPIPERRRRRDQNDRGGSLFPPRSSGARTSGWRRRQRQQLAAQNQRRDEEERQEAEQRLSATQITDRNDREQRLANLLGAARYINATTGTMTAHRDEADDVEDAILHPARQIHDHMMLLVSVIDPRSVQQLRGGENQNLAEIDRYDNPFFTARRRDDINGEDLHGSGTRRPRHRRTPSPSEESHERGFPTRRTQTILATVPIPRILDYERRRHEMLYGPGSWDRNNDDIEFTDQGTSRTSNETSIFAGSSAFRTVLNLMWGGGPPSGAATSGDNASARLDLEERVRQTLAKRQRNRDYHQLLGELLLRIQLLPRQERASGHSGAATAPTEQERRIRALEAVDTHMTFDDPDLTDDDRMPQFLVEPGFLENLIHSIVEKVSNNLPTFRSSACTKHPKKLEDVLAKISASRKRVPCPLCRKPVPNSLIGHWLVQDWILEQEEEELVLSHLSRPSKEKHEHQIGAGSSSSPSGASSSSSSTWQLSSTTATTPASSSSTSGRNGATAARAPISSPSKAILAKARKSQTNTITDWTATPTKKSFSEMIDEHDNKNGSPQRDRLLHLMDLTGLKAEDMVIKNCPVRCYKFQPLAEDTMVLPVHHRLDSEDTDADDVEAGRSGPRTSARGGRSRTSGTSHARHARGRHERDGSHSYLNYDGTTPRTPGGRVPVAEDDHMTYSFVCFMERIGAAMNFGLGNCCAGPRSSGTY
ncbi:unnamed protein product [Amoebophrya sp. A120]|nr:unnamed protein product [Amoebophrya sp. A120]|eukprot:GSA120T00022459001.1